MGSNAKKVTFSLPVQLIERYKGYVDAKDVASFNSAVREAMEVYADRIDREKINKSMACAAEDPLFMEDLNESMDVFEFSDAENE